jgi:hypothetical protein
VTDPELWANSWVALCGDKVAPDAGVGAGIAFVFAESLGSESGDGVGPAGHCWRGSRTRRAGGPRSSSATGGPRRGLTTWGAS